MSEKSDGLLASLGGTLRSLGDEFRDIGTQRITDAMLDALGGPNPPEQPTPTQNANAGTPPPETAAGNADPWMIAAIGAGAVAILALIWR